MKYNPSKSTVVETHAKGERFGYTWCGLPLNIASIGEGKNPHRFSHLTCIKCQNEEIKRDSVHGDKVAMMPIPPKPEPKYLFSWIGNIIRKG